MTLLGIKLLPLQLAAVPQPTMLFPYTFQKVMFSQSWLLGQDCITSNLTTSYFSFLTHLNDDVLFFLKTEETVYRAQNVEGTEVGYSTV
jgi:hypothetical protein